MSLNAPNLGLLGKDDGTYGERSREGASSHLVDAHHETVATKRALKLVHALDPPSLGLLPHEASFGRSNRPLDLRTLVCGIALDEC